MKKIFSLEFPCFLYDPMNVGNLISGSSAFSKSILYTWKFSVYVLLKPSLENFEHYFVSMWDKCNNAIVWTLFGIAFLWDWNDWINASGVYAHTRFLFQSCGHCWVSEICWHIEFSTLTASSFRIWNSSAEVPSPPLTLFITMLPKAHLTSHSRMSGPRWVITPLW